MLYKLIRLSDNTVIDTYGSYADATEACNVLNAGGYDYVIRHNPISVRTTLNMEDAMRQAQRAAESVALTSVAKYDYPPVIIAILDDPATSYWLKSAIIQLMERDCLDAARDAHALRNIMNARVDFTFHED